MSSYDYALKKVNENNTKINLVGQLGVNFEYRKVMNSIQQVLKYERETRIAREKAEKR